MNNIQKMGSNNENLFDQICVVSRKGRLVVWGGRDRANTTEFQMVFFNLSNLLIRSFNFKTID